LKGYIALAFFSVVAINQISPPKLSAKIQLFFHCKKKLCGFEILRTFAARIYIKKGVKKNGLYI